MGKPTSKKESRRKAEHKLERARQKFEATQEQYLLIREQGKQQVEKAQLQADRKLTKMHEQLQKRAQALMRAEERMLALGIDEGRTVGGSITPEGAADSIQQVQSEQSGAATGTEAAAPDYR
jgi:triphosphoribosyl-dephospho-CoA synthetase